MNATTMRATMPTREHTKGTTRIGVEYGVVAVKKQTRYFSITVAGAPQHELVLKLWPDLAPLVALHLSDVDGAPHSAEANGWYWLAGACGGLGEEVHGANGDPKRTAAECLKTFADHGRITLDHARTIASAAKWAASRPGAEPRKLWTAICDNMRPRWKAEADAARKQFGI
jgi:hypothetical protein